MWRPKRAIMQVAFLVDDLDAAIDEWVSLHNVGPFFVDRHTAYAKRSFRGAPAAWDVSLAFAYSGDLQIELVQCHDDAPSVFSEFRRAHGCGAHHLGAITPDLAGDLRAFAARGVAPVQHAVSSAGIETAFFETGDVPGQMLELIQGSDALHAGFAALKAAADAWDGKTARLN
jgi:methylmalonyl-CoA/ethylmalonyl-CoA epimerase